MRHMLAGLAIALTVGCPWLLAQQPYSLELPTKKLISFGWDKPHFESYKDNLSQLEASPFQGFGLELPASVNGGRIFCIDDWRKVSEANKEEVLQIASSFPKSRNLSDNFVTLYGESTMDWTNDEHWLMVEEQLRFCASVARTSGCRGILWDAEPYGKKKTWSYHEQTDSGGQSFEEYSQTIVKRGQRFVDVIQNDYPDLVILSLRQLSDFQAGSPYSTFLFGETNPEKRKEKLEWSYWGLHLPFTVGMLNACKGATVIHDGNEDAYYYTNALDFYKATVTLRTEGRQLLPKESRTQFDRHYKFGHAVSVDYTCGNFAKLLSFPAELRLQASELSEAERASWFEHNLFHALQSTDEYVWIYTEPTSFWRNENIPPGYLDAIHRAITNQKQGISPNFVIESRLQKVRQNLKAIKN